MQATRRLVVNDKVKQACPAGRGMARRKPIILTPLKQRLKDNQDFMLQNVLGLTNDADALV
jgi:hypothetical protein